MSTSAIDESVTVTKKSFSLNIAENCRNYKYVKKWKLSPQESPLCLQCNWGLCSLDIRQGVIAWDMIYEHMKPW